MDAFISYASRDAAAADAVERALEADKLKVWRDVAQIGIGNLLRGELRSAIAKSRCVVLLWSKAAARSRWVAAEILTAYHLDKFIVPVVLDTKGLPQFLGASVYLDFANKQKVTLESLPRAVRKAPKSANPLLPPMSSRSGAAEGIADSLNRAQHLELEFLGKRDLEKAREIHRLFDAPIRFARKMHRFDVTILSLAGYHAKNGYMEKHWDAIQAGRPPKDKLLGDAEKCFIEALLVDPRDYVGLDGLGSVLMLERELEAAAFFFEKAVALAAADGVDYPEAKENLRSARHSLGAGGR
jgi:tetratricopeptide (TPR) repeat protein